MAAALVMGGAEVNDEPITWGRFVTVVGFLALAAIIAKWPKGQKKFVSNVRPVRRRT
jgi:hypothetical protein